jgi:hypothetical protein
MHQSKKLDMIMIFLYFKKNILILDQTYFQIKILL